MADNKQYGETELVLPHPVIIDYPHLFKPDPTRNKYSAAFLIDKDTEEGKDTGNQVLQCIINATKKGFVDGTLHDGAVDPHADDFDAKVKAFVATNGFHDFVKLKRLVTAGAITLPNIDPNAADEVLDNQVQKFTQTRSEFRIPLRDGDGKVKGDKYKEYAGRRFFNASSKADETHGPVPAVDMNRQPLTSTTLYSGALVRARVWFVVYTQNGFGVRAQLSAVVKTGDGERLGGGTFDPLDGFGLPDEPTASTDAPKNEDPFDGVI